MKIDRNKLGKQSAPDAGNYISALFSSSAGAPPAEVPLDQLTPWQDSEHSRQPFRPYTPEKLKELAENIAQYGVLSPIFVRPFESGYQILAGHNRVAAAKLAGLISIPAVIRNLDNATAALVLTDSNLYQREKLLPSEKAWAYRIRLEALNSQGKRNDLTSCQVGTKLRSDKVVAENTLDSARTIQRFIRLTYLIEPFLDLVDADKMKFTVGVTLSHLSENSQSLLLQLMERRQVSRISLSQAEELKAFADKLDEPLMLRILGMAKDPSPQMITIKIPSVALPPRIPKAIFSEPEFQQRLSALINQFIIERKGDG